MWFSGTKSKRQSGWSERRHDDDGVGATNILAIHTMSLCMTYLTEVLRRCTTLPDPTSSWEKSVCGENGCRSEAAIAVLLSR